MLDTDQLRSFIAIVDTGSFTRAATRVNKTQSAVSMHIRRLEDRLGKRLFNKSGRGVLLSREGEALIYYARTMLAAEAHALSAIAGKDICGHIRLGIPDDYVAAYLADLMHGFSRYNPLAEVQVICRNSVDLARMTRKGELDLSIVTVDEKAPDIEILAEEQLQWIASTEHRQIENQRPLPVALGSPICCWTHAALKSLQSAGIEARQVLISNNYTAIAPIVEAGLAITAFPKSVICNHFRIIPPGKALPPLPKSAIGMVQAPLRECAETDAMADLIRQTIRGTASRPS